MAEGTGIDNNTDPNPVHSNAFGAAEDSDATRQAQHGLTNDTPVDVNRNALLAAEQGRAIAQMGTQAVAAAARLEMISQSVAAKIAILAAA